MSPRSFISCLSLPDVRSIVVHIYGLVDRATGEVRYVGKSPKPESRLRGHCSADASLLVRAWVRSLRERGQLPGLRILWTVPAGQDISRFERHFISEYAQRGRLLNMHLPGGTNRRVVHPWHTGYAHGPGGEWFVDADTPLALVATGT